jgi:hypothetical protein
VPGETMEKKGRQVVIACRVMEPEISKVLSERNVNPEAVEVLYLDQAMHRTPRKLLELVQETIDQVSPTALQIVLGYGLCSNGVVGVKARQQELIIPRCHDCIALFLGSPGRYQEIFRSRPGTYYLTPGWIAEKQDLLGLIEEQTPRYGRDTAQWMIEEELKHYTHIVMIDPGGEDIEPLRARGKENAITLNKQYEEIPGSLDYFREILYGPYREDKFFRLRPGEQFTQELAFSLL